MDCLRALSTIAVIVLHVVTILVHDFGKIPSTWWWLGNSIDSLVRFCVPVFLMMSGALLLSKTYPNIPEYLTKRISRILLPFLLWSFIYIFRTFWVMHAEGKPLDAAFVIKYILIQLKNGAAFHLWYVYCIVGLYLFFPILSAWIKNSNKSAVVYFLGIWWLTLFFSFPTISEYIPDFNFRYFTGYIGYPILGFYLMEKKFDNLKIAQSLSIGLIIIGFSITALGTYCISMHYHGFSHMFYEYLTPNVALTSIGVFLLFKQVEWPTEGYFQKAITFLSTYSYGIYLAHIFVIWELGKYGLNYLSINPFLGIPLTSLACLLISSLMVWGIKKLPFGKYVSG